MKGYDHEKLPCCYYKDSHVIIIRIHTLLLLFIISLGLYAVDKDPRVETSCINSIIIYQLCIAQEFRINIINATISLYSIKRRGHFLERLPANPEFHSSIKGGVVTFEKY